MSDEMKTQAEQLVSINSSGSLIVPLKEAEGDYKPLFCNSQFYGYVSGMKLGNGFDESNFVGNRPAPYTTPMKKHNRGIIDDKLEELHQLADKISDE